MKVLVTGSEGYIGIRLVEVMLSRGFDVVGLDTGFYRSGWLYTNITKLPKIICKDVRDITDEDLQGFDAIVHLAELSNDPVGQNDPELTFKINHKGTVALVERAKRMGIKKFVYTSSCSVYGASEYIADETSATNPLTAYAKSKILNEQSLKTMADDDFSPTFLRNATVYGPSPRMRFDLVVNNLAGLAWTEKEITMDSDGTPWRPFVHILDVCEAIIRVLEAPKETVHNQIFNVGDSSANYQIKDIARVIEEVFPGSTVSMNKDGSDKRNYRVNFDKINSKLPGFKCTRNITIGAQELKKVFEQIQMTKEDFISRHYTRLKQIKYLKDTHQVNDELYWNK